MIERWHRTLKSALMCSPKPWTEILSTVLLGLRTSYKEDILVSPAEMLYGTTLRIPGEFFINGDFAAEPPFFLEKHREFMRGLRPTPTAHHVKSRIFIPKDLHTCSHAFLRSDHVKAPLEQPYRGPYKITKRSSDTIFELDIDGTLTKINIDRLKPAYISKTDVDIASEPTQTDRVPEHQWSSTANIPTKTYSKKKVSFNLPLKKT
ncbi:hypothetical protein WN55_05451 [Dufourea novaeangliae]|uniref:Integrase catalytic domain-containing protein n=1 Tax=Dufourea novaeangliae TaxID=178035 RepID=A0A154P0P1_DUFNO|nr:hypothetical protein WN55_05451 [Dufourea novaeangliae]